MKEMARLVEKEVVAIKVFDAEDFGFRIAERVKADSEARKVHHHATLVADDLALTRRRKLQKILMQLDRKNTGTKGDFHEHRGSVFNIDLEVAPMATDSVHAA